MIMTRTLSKMGKATVLSSIVNDKLGLTTFMGERLADEYDLIPRDIFSKKSGKIP